MEGGRGGELVNFVGYLLGDELALEVWDVVRKDGNGSEGCYVALTMLLLASECVALLMDHVLLRRDWCWSLLSNRHAGRIHFRAIILGDIFGKRDF